jgi:hypothetical protein
MTNASLPSPAFLAVTHSFFQEECGEVPPDQDQAVTKLLATAISSPTMSAVALADAISRVIGRCVDFPNRIHAILTVPDEPPERHAIPLSQDGSRRQNPWSKDEDNRLLRGIQKYSVDNWAAVARFVGNGRSRAQCSQRWNRGLNPQLNKRLWSREDDERLRALVLRYGVKAWTRIAHEMGTRSDIQCRYHFLQLQRTRRPETPQKQPQPAEEQQLDLETAKTPSTWDLFAFPGPGPLLSFDRREPPADQFF